MKVTGRIQADFFIGVAGDTHSKVIQRYTNPRPLLARRDFKTNEKKKASWETR